MSKHLLGTVALALSAALIAPTFIASHAEAKPTNRWAKKKEKKKDDKETGKIAKAPVLKPAGLKWSQSPKAVAKLFDGVIQDDYLARLQAVSPGVQLTRLENEISERKAAFARSHLDLNAAPSNLDGTNLSGEFGYGSGESVMQIERKGKKTTLFFLGSRKRSANLFKIGKLWKVIDIYAYKGKWGTTFASAVVRVAKILGVPGKLLKADEDGRTRQEVVWTDGTTNVRVIDHGAKQFAIAYEQASRLPAVQEARKNAVKDAKSKISKGTQKVLRK